MPHRRWMPRLIRVTSTLISALVLSVWAASLMGSASWDDGRDMYRASVARGMVDVVFFDSSAFTVTRCGGGMPPKALPSWTIGRVRFQYGFYFDEPLRWRPRFSGDGQVCWMLNAPLWLLLAPPGAAAAISNGRALRKWRRGRTNGCRACGYDRAGIATTAVCPECGTASDA